MNCEMEKGRREKGNGMQQRSDLISDRFASSSTAIKGTTERSRARSIMEVFRGDLSPQLNGSDLEGEGGRVHLGESVLLPFSVSPEMRKGTLLRLGSSLAPLSIPRSQSLALSLSGG